MEIAPVRHLQICTMLPAVSKTGCRRDQGQFQLTTLKISCIPLDEGAPAFPIQFSVPKVLNRSALAERDDVEYYVDNQHSDNYEVQERCQ